MPSRPGPSAASLSQSPRLDVCKLRRAWAVLALLLPMLCAAPAVAKEQWSSLPTLRLLFGPNFERGSAVTVEGTEYALKSGGLGSVAGLHLSFGPIQPFFEASIAANIKSASNPCRNSPFEADVLLCEDTGAPIRVLGTVKAGARVVPAEEGLLHRLGATVGVQYLVQSLYARSGPELGEPKLLYGQLEWAGGDYYLSAAAGQGGFAAVEYARAMGPNFFDTLLLRIERQRVTQIGDAWGNVAIFLYMGTLGDW